MRQTYERTFQPITRQFRGKYEEKTEVVIEAELVGVDCEDSGKLGPLKVSGKQLVGVAAVVFEFLVSVEKKSI